MCVDVSAFSAPNAFCWRPVLKRMTLLNVKVINFYDVSVFHFLYMFLFNLYVFIYLFIYEFCAQDFSANGDGTKLFIVVHFVVEWIRNERFSQSGFKELPENENRILST